MNVPRPADVASHLAVGITTYGSVLAGAGGEQLALVSRAVEQPSLSVVLYRSPPYELSVQPLDVLRLSINLTASRVSGGVASERRRSFEAKRHSMFMTPTSAAVHWRKQSPSRHLTIYVPAQSDDADCAAHLHRCGPVFNVRLPECADLVGRRRR